MFYVKNPKKRKMIKCWEKRKTKRKHHLVLLISSIMRSIYSTFNHLDVIIIHQKNHKTPSLLWTMFNFEHQQEDQPTNFTKVRCRRMRKDHHHDLHLHHYYMAIKIFNLCYALYNLWWYTLRFQTGFLTTELDIKWYTHSISNWKEVPTRKLWSHYVVQLNLFE